MTITYAILLPEVTISAGVNDTISLVEDSDSPATVTIPPGSYFMRGDAAADDLAGALQTALGSAYVGNNQYTIYLQFDTSSGGINMSMSIERTAGARTFQLQWGTNGLEDMFGFASGNTANNSSAKVATLSSSVAWVSNQPTEKTDEHFNSVVHQTVMSDGSVRTFQRTSVYDLRDLSFAMVDGDRTLTSLADADSDANRSFETFWRLARDGRRFEYYEAPIETGTLLPSPITTDDASGYLGRFVLDAPSLQAFRPMRHSPGVALYTWSLATRKYVS